MVGINYTITLKEYWVVVTESKLVNPCEYCNVLIYSLNAKNIHAFESDKGILSLPPIWSQLSICSS